MVHVSKKGFLNDGLECDCLIHATIFPGAICIGCINVCLKRNGRRGCRGKPVLGICLVEATRCNCGDSGAVS